MRCDRPQRSPAPHTLRPWLPHVQGFTSREIAAAFQYEVSRAGLSLAYPSIVTVRGEVLHNFEYVNTLASGQLLLLDGGAEAATGYATKTSHARGR